MKNKLKSKINNTTFKSIVHGDKKFKKLTLKANNNLNI
jgi:hypothetical protein